uniref:Uncharacterized protein n=1 Tax=Salarias fasciatus TaxID=181472 RepID=A0A672IJT3_SALFA
MAATLHFRTYTDQSSRYSDEFTDYRTLLPSTDFTVDMLEYQPIDEQTQKEFFPYINNQPKCSHE